MDKATLRKHFLDVRSAVEDKHKKSSEIMARIRSMKAYDDYLVIAVFASMPLEVDTSDLWLHALADGKTVAFPRVEGQNLVFYSVKSPSDLTPTGPMEIREPSPEKCPIVPKETIDLIIVPGLCFDSKKYRLGYGKGFYDRYLKDCRAFKIGVCFNEQRYRGELPITENDIPVDSVVSA